MIKFIYMIDEGDFMNMENKNAKKLFILMYTILDLSSLVIFLLILWL